MELFDLVVFHDDADVFRVIDEVECPIGLLV